MVGFVVEHIRRILVEKILVRQNELPIEQFSTMGCRTMNGYDINAESFYKENIKNILNGDNFFDEVISGVRKDSRGNICLVTII